MKKGNVTFLIASVVLTGILLFSACSNVYSPAGAVAGSGEGNVTVSLSAGPSGRTLMPSALDFDVYEFTFTNDGYEQLFTKEKGTDGISGSFTFGVPVGNDYMLNVKAYKVTGEGKILAAEGNSSVPFTVSSATSVTVKLTGNISEGETGTFSYYIQYPSNSWIERFVLVGPGSSEINLKETANQEGDIVMMGSEDVTAGWYGLELDLKDSDGKVAYVDDMAVIYSDTTTFYGTEINPIVISSAKFKTPDTSDPYAGVRVYDWHGFNVEGACLYEDNDTSKQDFNFSNIGEYYFDRGRAIGTKYDSFKDADGNPWTDVLKLEPPKEINPAHYSKYNSTINGYQPNTFIMTYPITESGTYKISMSIWVEESDEAVYLVWYAVPGGWTKFVEMIPSPDGLYPKVDIERGKWINLTGEKWLNAGMEIAMGARSGDLVNGGGGLRDASIYIRDMVMKKADGVIVPPDPDPDNFIITPANFSLIPGRTKALSASREVESWSSDAPEVASVDANGVVTANSLGTAVITAVSNEDPSELATATVKVVTKGSLHIALTFDDGPWEPWTSSFKEILKGKAHATFFINGLRLDQTPEVSRALLEDGHELANHTYDHIFTGPESIRIQSVPDIRRELIKVQNAIENVTGQTTLFLRAPALLYIGSQPQVTDTFNFENIPMNEDQYEGPFMEAAASLGMSFIDASYHQLGNHDWDNRTPQEIFDRVKLVAKDDGILLLHDSYGNPHNTEIALPWIIEWLTDEGYEILNVSEMVARKKVASLTPGRIYYDFINGVPESLGEVVPVSKVSVLKDGSDVSGNVFSFSGEGETLELAAEISPPNASLNKIYWYSDNDYAATVDDNGKVTAVGRGTAVIRAVAGTIVGKVKVRVDSVPITKTTWDVFNWPGEDGISSKDGDPYLSSNAIGEVIDNFYSPEDGKMYSNVFKLSPPAEGYPYDPGDAGRRSAGSLAMNYVIPYTGTYTLSMDIWVESERDDVNLIWYVCDTWEILSKPSWSNGVSTQCWESGTASLKLVQGMTIGLLARNYKDEAGLRNATIYIKDLTLTLDDLDDLVIDIRSPVTTVPHGTPGVTFEWADGAVPLTVNVSGGGSVVGQESVTVTKDSVVTITAPSFTSYQWLIGRKEVSATDTYTFTATEDCTILLWVDGKSKGASITVVVE